MHINQLTEMNYLFTSESVSEGHPDKVADQISDAVLDEFLARDPQSKVACETLVTTGQVVLAGEIKSSAYVDLHEVVRRVIGEIGYNDSRIGFDAQSCGILSAICCCEVEASGWMNSSCCVLTTIVCTPTGRCRSSYSTVT